MTLIEIPSEILSAAGLEPEDVPVELALELFRQGRLKASQLRALTGNSTRLKEAFQKSHEELIDLDSFLSWAAHDLRAPLNSMIGFTRVVLKGIDGPINEVQATDLNAAHTSAQRLLGLINNLIDMARMNKDEVKIELTPGDLFQTVLDATTRWKSQNPAKELDTEIEANIPIFSFDPARLRQVITGLLSYSANHVAEGGRVELSAHLENQGIRFDINSSGEKISDKYELDSTMQALICSGLIRLHGGRLDLGHETGTGHSLYFTLPISD